MALIVPTRSGCCWRSSLNRQASRQRASIRSIFYFPAILSLSLTGLICTWIYHPTLGFLNQLLGWVGLDRCRRAWLSEPSVALFAVMVAAAWHNTGLPMLLYLAGLQTIPKEVLEAARGGRREAAAALPLRDSGRC